MSLRIDAHVHLLPEEYTAELDRRSLLSSPLPPWSPELLDELMARHEIDAAVLSLSPPGVWFGDGPLAVELAGVALLSNVDGIYHGDPAWDPLWAELERRGAYAMLHPSAPPNPPPLPHHPVWLYEYPFDTTRAIVNLVYSGTLERSPSVRLQVAHLGGAAPFL